MVKVWGALKASSPAVSAMPGQARWTALLAQAQWALAQVSQEMQEYYDERSEAWQESERGADFAQRLEAVQEVLEGLTELDAADTKKPSKPLTDHLVCLHQAVVGRIPRESRITLPLAARVFYGSPDALDARAVQDGLSEFASLDALPPMRNPTASLLVPVRLLAGPSMLCKGAWGHFSDSLVGLIRFCHSLCGGSHARH